jgi:hypothetical protein
MITIPAFGRKKTSSYGVSFDDYLTTPSHMDTTREQIADDMQIGIDALLDLRRISKEIANEKPQISTNIDDRIREVAESFNKVLSTIEKLNL